jgi:hypothetical protein
MTKNNQNSYTYQHRTELDNRTWLYTKNLLTFRKNIKMMKNISIAALAGTLIAGCATESADIAASYVSPMQYQNLSCSQLTQEAQRVSTRVAQVSARQDEKASSDAGAMAIGMILFWPALFLLDGDEESASEVARLKGEMDAIEQANIQKNCGIQFG